jgi:hypothetical protein
VATPRQQIEHVPPDESGRSRDQDPHCLKK